MRNLDPQEITPELEHGHIRETPTKTLADYDSPEFVVMDDQLSRAEKISILESWLPTKQGEVELNAYGQEVDANAPYTRRVKLALDAVRAGDEDALGGHHLNMNP